jgi:hypothetical protein
VFCAGNLALEGRVEHKFDMEPHSDNFGEYGKLCRERTNRSMIKTRQVQVQHMSFFEPCYRKYSWFCYCSSKNKQYHQIVSSLVRYQLFGTGTTTIQFQ